MDPKYAAKLLKRRARDAAPTFDISKYLFKQQLDFIADPARFATAVCSVRAGKTVSCAADLMNTATLEKGITCIYVTLARSSAERIVWPELKRINREFKLGVVFNETKLTAKTPSGSTIYLFGANNDEEIEKMRGLSNVALVYLDECQAFRAHIKQLVEDIVVKRLYDTNGRCRLIGTPGPILAGYFYEAAHSDQWSHHAWTMHHNPWLLKKSGKTPDELILQDCAQRGVTIDDPSIQRECFGRWKHDPQSLLLLYDKATNDYETLPPGDYKYILGIDLGVRDSDSLSLLAFSNTSHVTYLVEEVVTPNQKTDDLAKQIQLLMAKYPIRDMPTDAGGLGLKIVEDLKARYGLPLTPADKREKMANYKHLNNALRTGIFKAKATTRFAMDCNLLERDDNRSTPDKIVVKGHSDSVDSCLYAFKLSPAYAYVPPAPTPTPGSPEHVLAQEALHLAAAIEKVERQRRAQDTSGNQMKTWNLDKKGIPDWNKW